MLLKIKSEREKLITVVQVATFEHSYEENTLKIWDMAEHSSLIIPEYTPDLKRVVRELYSSGRAEIDGEIKWE